MTGGADRDLAAAVLAGSEAFSACSAEEVAVVTRLSSLMRARAGTVLGREGERKRELAVIIQGRASARRGRKVVALEAGDVYGAAALLEGAPRDATLRCETDVSVLVLGEDALLGMIREIPSAARRIIRSLTGRDGNGVRFPTAAQ